MGYLGKSTIRENGKYSAGAGKPTPVFDRETYRFEQYFEIIKIPLRHVLHVTLRNEVK